MVNVLYCFQGGDAMVKIHQNGVSLDPEVEVRASKHLIGNSEKQPNFGWGPFLKSILFDRPNSQKMDRLITAGKNRNLQLKNFGLKYVDAFVLPKNFEERLQRDRKDPEVFSALDGS